MAIFKCKMCGGALDVQDGMSVIECEYCGTSQTLPKLDDEKKLNLFNRANRLRFSNEFDKAAGVYESIVSEFSEEAEAYWGLCLCKYGIEYVDDPITSKKIPTCHRTSYESIFDDSNFELAIEYADPVAVSVYRNEAKEIDRLQKSIIEIASKEKPFDIFICYKETDENGDRTKDSVLAQDMYDALTQKGYKVFFARITLEDKLGKEFEPYIFSALSTAKVMLAVGTKYEYFNAVWVKNEWSRFLDMMRADKDKTLIPCYCDIDAYDMPKEFKNLQGQDMSKIGFMQDLVRGVGKLLHNDEQAPIIKENIVFESSSNVEALMKRIFIFLEDEDFDSADEYCEKVLDIEPENAQVYLGKLLIELELRNIEELADYDEPFDNSANYQKIMRYADDDLKQKLQGYVRSIIDRNEHNRLESIYNQAVEIMNSAQRKEEFIEAGKLLKTIPGYRDADEMAVKCEELGEDAVYKDLIRRFKTAVSENQCRDIAEEFRKIIDYKDAALYVKKCEEKAEDCIKDKNYCKAMSLASSRFAEEIEEAIELFSMNLDWKDSYTRRDECQKKLEEIRKSDSEVNKTLSDLARRKRKQVICAWIFVAIIVVLAFFIPKEIKYQGGMKAFEDGEYLIAYEAFGTLGKYRNSEQKCEEAKELLYEEGITSYLYGTTTPMREAEKIFNILRDYKDSKKYLRLIGVWADGDDISNIYDLIDFADTKKRLETNKYFLEFLDGRWECGYYYIESEKGEREYALSGYNLPSTKGEYYKIENKTHYHGDNSNGWTAQWTYEILSEDEIKINSLINGETYIFERQ